MTQRDEGHNLRDSINRDRIYQQKKLEGLDNAINSLIKWKDEHKFCLMSDEFTDLNDIINDLTDRFIDLKDENKQQRKEGQNE